MLKLLRPNQWIKNLLVFAALFFSHSFLNTAKLASSAIAFLSFCLVASSIYIINDIFDRTNDREHPTKRFRPIASGKVSVPAATLLSGILLIGSLFVALTINENIAILVLSYFLINVLYSLRLKHIVILDAFIVSSGFVLRVIAGGLAINVTISHWIIICTFMLALFLAFGKRRHELLLAENSTRYRKVLYDYDKGFLDQMISVASASAIMSYILYSISPETIANFGTDKIIYTAPFVLFAIYRYQYLIYKKDSGGDPTKAIATDRGLLTSFLLWAISIYLIIYVL